MPRQPKLVKKINNGYEYWGASVAGKTVRFGRCDQVPWAEAYSEFLKALTGAPPVPKTPAERVEARSRKVEQLCQEHCAWHATANSPSTTSNRIGFLDRWCSHSYQGHDIGGLPATTIRKEHLADFMQANFKVDGWTSWNYCVAIKAAFNWAFREGHLKENHLARYPNPPQPRADVSELTLMTAKEVTWFLGKGEAYGVGDVLRVLHATGARPGELCSALVSDFVSSAKQLRLLHWKNGRKTGMSRRIPLSEEATAIVVRLCRRRKGDEPIFTGPDGAAWTPNRLQKIFRKIREGKWRGLTDGGQFEQLTQKQALLRIKKTAQRESLTLYDFRHLWISDALQQGVPVATIATMAGTSIKMVEKTYGHFRSDDLGAVASMIEKRRQRSV